MRLLALGNPRSGRGAGLGRFWRYRAMGSVHDIEWVVARDVEDMRERIRRSSAGGAEGVLVVGGDGTLNDALPALVETDLPFGVLAAGRGNDFVRNLGLTRDQAATLLRRPHPGIRAVDLALVNGKPFVSVAGVGFDGEVTRLANAGAGLVGGTTGYVVCVLRALNTFRPWSVTVAVDDWIWAGEVALVAVANGPCFGGGMLIAPGASLTDGLLDVCIVGAMSRRRLLWEFPKVFWGGHVRHPGAHLRRGRTVRVTTDRPEDIYADGEWAGRTPGEWSVRPQTLRVLV